MSKYTEHFKLTAITAYLEGRSGFRKVAQRFGIDFSLLRRWVAIYQTHASTSLRSTGQRYSTAFKLNVLAHMHEHHLSLRQTAAYFGLGQSSQIGIWERQYYSDRPTAAITIERRMPVKVPKKITPVEPTDTDDALKSREQLMSELEYLRMENAYLKELKALREEEKRRQAKKR